MVSFNKFWGSVLLAILHTTTVASAMHWSSSNTIIVGRDLEVEVFNPEMTFETYQDGIVHSLSSPDIFSVEAAALAFVQSHTNLSAVSVQYYSGYSTEISSHAYLRQAYHGIPISNAVANIAFNADNNVIAFGSAFIKPKSIAPPTPTVSVEAATEIAEKALLGTANNIPGAIEYLAKKDGSVVLTHVIQIFNDETQTYGQAFIDAHTGEFVSYNTFVANAQYLAIPIQKQAPPEGFETITNPEDLVASPLGWHATSSNANTNSTFGNNAVSFKAAQNNVTYQSSPNLVFNYPWDSKTDPQTPENIKAACVQAFYVINKLHDLWYQYGFTEARYNFQHNNFGKGGLGGDFVEIYIQDNRTTNNAGFATPPDGQPGRLYLFLWTFTTPFRDSAFANDLLIHEFTHGLTNRMTGGATGQCFKEPEGQGMAEGWSDAMADLVSQKSQNIQDFIVAKWLYPANYGIRKYPFSTNSAVNPLRYSNGKNSEGSWV